MQHGDALGAVLKMKTADILHFLPKTKTKSEPAGFLFHRFSIIFLSVVLFVALVQNHHYFTAIVSLALALAFFAKVLSRIMLQKVYGRLSLAQRHFFPGDSGVINIEISNNKLVPLFWAHAEVLIPPGVIMTNDNGSENAELAFDFSLSSWTEASFRPAFICRNRGYYPLKNLTLFSGDLFGLYRQKAEFTSAEAIIVYPRLYLLKDWKVFSLYPTGGVSFKEQLFHDHTRTMGVRDYSTSDEFRHIHWKASARRDRLQVKVFEPTTTGQLILFLPREEFADKQELENAICMLAAIGRDAVGEGNSVGLISNCVLADSGNMAVVSPDSNKNGMDVLLESFAKINFQAGKPWDTFFPTILNQLHGGTTIVFAAVKFTEPVCRSIAGLRQAGYRVIVVHPGDRRDKLLQGEATIYKYSLHQGYIQCELQQ